MKSNLFCNIFTARNLLINWTNVSLTNRNGGQFFSYKFMFRKVSTTSSFKITLLQHMFNNEENKSVNTFMRDSPAYKNTLFFPTTTDSEDKFIQYGDSKSNEKATGKPFHPSVKNFIQYAMSSKKNSHPITSHVNKDVVEEVFSNLKSLSDKDLLEVLYFLRFFAPCPSAKDPDYSRIWLALDQECVSRMSSWNLDFLFIVADLWYGLFLSRLSSFHWKLVVKCFRKCDRLSKEHFIRFMFCLNLVRSIPDSFSTYDMEHYVQKMSNEKLSSQEVAIISMAFFKTETRIQNQEVLKKLLNVVIEGKSTIDSVSLAAVAKLARYSSSPKLNDFLIGFQDAFMTEINRLSITACTHLALIGTQAQIPHMELINTVVKKIERNVKETRLKELERISLVMTMFNADCDNLCQLIVNELRSPERAEEIRSYGRCLPAILHYLSIRQVFPQELISIGLSDGFRKTYYANKWEIYQRELLCLDFCAELEISDYNGKRLDKKTRENLTKKNILRLPIQQRKVSEYGNIVQRVMVIMEETLGGSDFICSCNILPHHNSIEIVYCTNEEGNPIKIPQHYRDKKDYEIKFIPSDSQNTRYHAVFICNRNTIRGNDLTGQGQLQVRHLKKMGYLVHIIFPSSFDVELFRNNLKNVNYDTKALLKQIDN